MSLTLANKLSDILFEDEDYLFVNKPPNELVIPDRFTDERSLQAKLSLTYGRLFVVHRLDRDTSGVICFARNEASHKYLSNLFMEHQVDKKYLALVDMKPEEDEGLIDIGIRESQRTRGLMKTHPKGKPSQTRYKVLESCGIASLLEVELLTGRTHQIRVHLKHIGTPLLVDKKYGLRDKFFLSTIKGRKFNLSKGAEEKPILERQSLHAFSMQFKNKDGRLLSVEAPLPKDLRALLNQLRKNAR